jgi:hypothetical protein
MLRLMKNFFLRKSTKVLGLVLIGGSMTVAPGCQHTVVEDQPIAAVNNTHVYPTWWWWYMHRPYFSVPLYSTHTVHFVGSGGSYIRTGGYSYSASRSVTGAKVGGGSFRGGSTISARGGFTGASSVAS